jgi:hypothetical protein
MCEAAMAFTASSASPSSRIETEEEKNAKRIQNLSGIL